MITDEMVEAAFLALVGKNILSGPSNLAWHNAIRAALEASDQVRSRVTEEQIAKIINYYMEYCSPELAQAAAREVRALIYGTKEL